MSYSLAESKFCGLAWLLEVGGLLLSTRFAVASQKLLLALQKHHINIPWGSK